MTRFHFPLAKVRDFRQRNSKMEEAKLEALHAERRRWRRSRRIWRRRPNRHGFR